MAIIGIVGGTLSGNSGAETMCVVTVAMVRRLRPDAHVRVFSLYPDDDRAVLSDNGVEIVDAGPLRMLLAYLPGAMLGWGLNKSGRSGLMPRLLDALVPLRSCDLVLDVSGITFVDGRELILPVNVLMDLPAMLCGVPVVKLAQAMGPFENPLNRVLAQQILSRCRHVYARGRCTADNVAALDIGKGRWSEAADTGFLYDEAFSLSQENPDKVEATCAALDQHSDVVHKAGKQVIGVAPSSVLAAKMKGGGRAYVALLCDYVSAVVAAGHHVVVVPNATRDGRWRRKNNDLWVVNRMRVALERKLGSEATERVSWVDFSLNTAGVRAFVRRCDLLVASRFHAMIAALALGVPTVVAGWSHKYHEVMEVFGLADYCVDYREAADLLNITWRALEQRDHMVALLRQHIERVRASAERQFDESLTDVTAPPQRAHRRAVGC